LEVGIKLEIALATEEIGLRSAVAPVDIATPVAPLAGMPGVYGDNLAAKSLRLILKESLELGEAPGMEPALGFPAGGFDAAPDVGKVFHNDSCPGLNAVKDRGGKNVVAISSESLFTTSKDSEMPLGRLRSLSLQRTSETKDTLDDFFHMPVAVKAVVRSDSRSGNPQVNADSLAVRSKLNIRQADDNVKVKPALAVNKVGCGRRLASRVPGIFRKGERYLHSALSGGQIDNPPVPIYLEGVQVVPGRAHCGLRATYPAALLQIGDCRPDGFAGFLSGLDMQVGDEGRQRIFAVAISQAVKRVGIASSLFPAHAADSIKRLGKLLNRLMQGFKLFPVRLKQYSYRPVHIQSIPYSTQILQRKEEAGQFLCQLKQAVPLP
jgi:hypothetical protein